ncbi:MAG: hypothetical protein IJU23_01960 [Proteobacteria bacterium]|nr:hypothetical protein [Pseudomonadota bacterium]
MKECLRGIGKTKGMGMAMAVCLSLMSQIASAEDLQNPQPSDESQGIEDVVIAPDDDANSLENTGDPEIVSCRESTDRDCLMQFSTAFNGDLTESEQSLVSALGLDGNSFSDIALSRVRSFSQDKNLDYLLSLYQAYRAARNASGMLDESELLTLLDEENDLDARDRVAVMQTILPLLIDYAVSERDPITIRKYSAQSGSYERLWPGQRFHIVCQHDESAIEFGLNHSGDLLNITGLKPLLPLCRNDVMPETPSTEQNAVICYAIRGIESPEFTAESMDRVLSRTLSALISKDNQLCAIEVRHLIDAVSRLKEWQKSDGNDSENSALNEQWLCQLHVIGLLLLEQHRFAELMRLERGIQAAFKDGGFVNRLSLKCSNTLKQPFSDTYSRLETDYSNAYAWVKKQFQPKNIKNLDKNFKAWTKKGTANVKLTRRLIVMWALWSEGKYQKAAELAGNVTEGKSRLVHPQLHSLDVILKAASGEEISQEALETYIRVINLKSPWLVYQALSEAGRLFSKSQRKLAVSIMRLYNPADASADAALFYREYEKEIRENMSVQHLSRIDAWLETELRITESPDEANRRRVQWLKDLIAAENWQEIAGLSNLSLDDSPEEWHNFWANVECHAQTSCDCSSLSADTPFKCTLPENVESREAWFKQVASCL